MEKPVLSHGIPIGGKALQGQSEHDYHPRESRSIHQRLQHPSEAEVSPVEDLGLRAAGSDDICPSGRLPFAGDSEDELAKDWTKRRMKDDLVPETKR
uniref:Uncharacterized protein n=1 Tax=Sphaerodactylus townsendi TaxID=933632 RepID=A0ACB8F7N1_9SAUR